MLNVIKAFLAFVAIIVIAQTFTYLWNHFNPWASLGFGGLWILVFVLYISSKLHQNNSKTKNQN
jgi:hypothetical protein